MPPTRMLTRVTTTRRCLRKRDARTARGSCFPDPPRSEEGRRSYSAEDLGANIYSVKNKRRKGRRGASADCPTYLYIFRVFWFDRRDKPRCSYRPVPSIRSTAAQTTRLSSAVHFCFGGLALCFRPGQRHVVEEPVCSPASLLGPVSPTLKWSMSSPPVAVGQNTYLIARQAVGGSYDTGGLMAFYVLGQPPNCL